MSAFNNLLTLVNENKKSINFNYNGIEDLIIIDGKLFDDINARIETLDSAKLDTKNLIKKALKTALNLENQTLIVIKREYILIRLIKNIVRKTIDERHPSEANRYNGYSMHEIEELYAQYFREENIDEFMQDIANIAFKFLFVRKQVTNDYYEKNIFPLLQNFIIEKLVDFDDEEYELKKGFAGYILRINFLRVFSYLSDAILEAISIRNEYLMNWLKYYNGQIVVKGDQRYEAPLLANNDGQKYNPSAIFGTVAMWFKTKEKIQTLRKRFLEIHAKLRNSKIDNLTPRQYKNELIKERQEVEHYIYEANEHMKNLLDERVVTKNHDAKFEINEEIKELRKELRQDKDELDEINTEIMSVDTITSKSLEENLVRIEKDLLHEETALKQSTKLYESIHAALVIALTSKRQSIAK